MKTINFELSKRLNDEGLLDNIKTMYSYNKSGGLGDSFYHRRYIYKTLTLEELPKFIFNIVGKEKLNKYLNSRYSALEIFNFSINDYEKIINDLILNEK